MAAPPPAEVTVRRRAQVQARLQDHILAWARDVRSGRLRYILELSESERGAACGCMCASCDQPLVAVNAAKSEWARRPHFRHESGNEAHSCQILSARAALLASLQAGEMIALPRLRRSISIDGLSGTSYEGWVEIAPQLVRIGRVQFSDTTKAELLLDDGRRVQVVVVGSASPAGANAGETLVPRIEICIDDPALSTMSPEELRARLVPALETGTWCGHWPDAAADAVARGDALRAASDAFDWDPDVGELSADLRRESRLHREVKAILAQASSISLPGWWLRRDGEIVTDPARGGCIKLLSARLERKLGRIIPDVIADTEAEGELLVEVTVTNTITAERLERIRAVNLATIEINFSGMAGVVSRDTLRDLVLNRVVGKKWLHHPAVATPQTPALEPAPVQLPRPEISELGLRQPENAVKRKADLLMIPAETWGQSYLSAVRELARIDVAIDEDQLWDPAHERDEAYRAVLHAADGLYLHGYPQALDHRLFDNQRTMLHRLMSIMTGTPVAYRYGKIWQVINSMLTDTMPEPKSWHSLYLLAIREREHHLSFSEKQRELLDEWRRRVRASLRQNEDDYRRDPRYDRLLELLFPDLSFGLENLGLKRPPAAAIPHPEGADPDLIDTRYYEEWAYDRWTWTMSPVAVVRDLEVVGAKARIEGWTVDDDSILYQLLRQRFSTNAEVWILASVVAGKLSIDPSPVLRFLRRNGYIMLKH
jgi:hypothetical protein